MKVLWNSKSQNLSDYFPFDVKCESCDSKLTVESPEDIWPFDSTGLGLYSERSFAIKCPVCKEWGYFDDKEDRFHSMDGFPKWVWDLVLKARKGQKKCPFPPSCRHHKPDPPRY